MFTSLFLMISEDCNLRCKYCYENGKAYQHMDTNVAKDAIDMLFKVDSDNLSVAIFGGEPLVNPSVIKEAVAYIREKEESTGKVCDITISTNGTILDDDILDTLRELNSVQLSIDGIKYVQDMNRPSVDGSSSYDVAIENAKKIIQAVPNVAIRMTVHPNMVKYFYECAIHLFGLGIKYIKFMEVPEAEWSKSALRMYEKELLGISEYIYNHRADGLRLDPLSNFSNMPPTRGCGAGTGSISVMPNGDIYPCIRFYTYARRMQDTEYKMGSIYSELDQDIVDIFNKATIDKMECGQCECNAMCNKCYACNLEMNGDIYTPTKSHCDITKINYRIARQLYERLQGTQNVSYVDERILDKIDTLSDNVNNVGSRYNDIVKFTDNVTERLIALEMENRELRGLVLNLDLRLRSMRR